MHNPSVASVYRVGPGEGMRVPSIVSRGCSPVEYGQYIDYILVVLEEMNKKITKLSSDVDKLARQQSAVESTNSKWKDETRSTLQLEIDGLKKSIQAISDNRIIGLNGGNCRGRDGKTDEMLDTFTHSAALFNHQIPADFDELNFSVPEISLPSPQRLELPTNLPEPPNLSPPKSQSRQGEDFKRVADPSPAHTPEGDEFQLLDHSHDI